MSTPRTVPVLAGAQVLGGVGVAAGIAVGGILAQEVSGSTALAGLAATMSVLGAAFLAVPLARLARSAGRRPALTVGYLVGAAGALLSLLAAVVGSFPLLLAGMLLFGGGSASGLQARYAATDAAPPEHRARALSLVVWATTVGVVAGPNLTGPGEALARAVGVPELTGPFLFSLAGFVLAALLLTLLLRPDPLAGLLVGRAGSGAGSGAGGAVAPARHQGLREVFAGVRAHPRALLGLVTVGTAHAVMVGVMVMTPVHLHDGGASLEVVGVVISVHVAGMYAASPVFGWIADRFGRERGIVLGVAVLMVALFVAGTAPATAHVQLGVALALLGLGWSSCLVSGSTLLTEAVEADVRTGVQGLSDLVMGVVAAAAGGLAGPLLALQGYPSLSVAAGIMLVPVVVLLAVATRQRRSALAARV